MEWYFFFVALIMFISISSNANRRIDRLDRKILLLLERIDVDVEEIDAEIARMDQKSTAKLKADQWERMSASVGPTFLGGALGFPLGMVMFPALGTYNLMWVPFGMALGFVIGLLLARKIGDDGASVKRVQRMK